MGLPAELNPFSWQKILDDFGNRCALSCSWLLSMDHFIPTSIGHGGTYAGNVYPLDPNLNSSKGDSNPYLWAEANRDKIDFPLFEILCNTLAEQNGLTPSEFRSYVFWCFSNPRTAAAIRNDPRPSLALWKEASAREQARSMVISYMSQQFALTEAGFCAFIAFCAAERLVVGSDAYDAFLASRQ